MSRYEIEKWAMTGNPRDVSKLDKNDRIRILLEEYRALYSLLTFRLSAMDRRLPVAGGALGAVLGAVTAMPPETKLAFLLGLPLGLLWLVLSTVQHGCSKEDHLRRIDEIERLVNQLAGEELLVFQSRHPNKRKVTAGRSGFAAVAAILTTSYTMLAVCGLLVYMPVPLLPANWLVSYAGFLAWVAGIMLLAVLRLRRYQYRRPPPDIRPISEIFSQE